jgi:hypothetical protein
VTRYEGDDFIQGLALLLVCVGVCVLGLVAWAAVVAIMLAS